MKKAAFFLICFTAAFFLQGATFVDQSPQHPTLPQDYLETFAPDTQYIMETSTSSDSVRVYDGQTGKFLLEVSKAGATTQAEVAEVVFSALNQHLGIS